MRKELFRYEKLSVISFDTMNFVSMKSTEREIRRRLLSEKKVSSSFSYIIRKKKKDKEPYITARARPRSPTDRGRASGYSPPAFTIFFFFFFTVPLGQRLVSATSVVFRNRSAYTVRYRETSNCTIAVRPTDKYSKTWSFFFVSKVSQTPWKSASREGLGGMFSLYQELTKNKKNFVSLPLMVLGITPRSFGQDV